jgi:hypothetical protein
MDLGEDIRLVLVGIGYHLPAPGMVAFSSTC